jgi:hypothetical protein
VIEGHYRCGTNRSPSESYAYLVPGTRFCISAGTLFGGLEKGVTVPLPELVHAPIPALVG